MYLVRSLRTFIGTNAERVAAGLGAFLAGDEFIETDTSNIYIHDGMAWLLNPGGSPGGSNGQLQYNNGGALGGDGALVWNNTSKIIELTKSNAGTSVPFIQMDNTGGGNASIEITTTGDNATIGFESGSFIISAASSTWITYGTQMQFLASDTLLLSGHSLPAITVQYTGSSQYETIINPISTDIDFRSSGDTATHLFVTDAGLDAVQIGTTVAGDIADFRSTGIVFNNSEADRDLRIAGNGVTNAYIYDAGNNRHGFGGVPTTYFEVNGPALFNVTTGGSGVELFKVTASEGGYFSVLDGSTSGFLPQFEFAATGLAAGGVVVARIPTGSDTFNAALAAMIIDGRIGPTGATGPSNANVLIVRGGATPFFTIGPTGNTSCNATTGAFMPNVLTTTQRNALTAVNGMLIYNSTTGKFQGRAAGSWVDLH